MLITLGRKGLTFTNVYGPTICYPLMVRTSNLCLLQTLCFGFKQGAFHALPFDKTS